MPLKKLKLLQGIMPGYPSAAFLLKKFNKILFKKRQLLYNALRLIIIISIFPINICKATFYKKTFFNEHCWVPLKRFITSSLPPNNELLIKSSETVKFHSEEYFGKQRDFWWNQDFLHLMSKRWNLSNYDKILDIGCGVGHWGQLLSPYFSPQAKIIGIDKEAKWIEVAQQRASASNSTKFSYIVGEAERLPFPNESFNLVTCQTLLMHVPDVLKVLQEVKRVLKPQGLFIASEPNNIARGLIRDNISYFLNDEELKHLIYFQIMCESGKRNLKLGDNSIGDMLPFHLGKSGFNNIQVYMSDKAFTILPTYNTESKVRLAQEEDYYNRNIWVWPREETEAYFLAGGGKTEEFIFYWQKARDLQALIIKASKENSYYYGGGSINYLISGVKTF